MCYQETEASLRYISKRIGFTYGMNNCHLNHAISRILEVCKCRPFFLDKGVVPDSAPFCTGTSIRCMYGFLSSMGGGKDEAVVVGNVSIPEPASCFSACNITENLVQYSSAKFPQSENFFFQPAFCQVARKILINSCNGTKKHFIDTSHPGLCPILEKNRELLQTCKNWPGSFIFGNKSFLGNRDDPYIKVASDDQIFIDKMQTYASKNLAKVNVYFRAPYVQAIHRDIEVTFASFVGNLGGLLGLCLGFSFVSFVELIYFCIFSKV